MQGEGDTAVYHREFEEPRLSLEYTFLVCITHVNSSSQKSPFGHLSEPQVISKSGPYRHAVSAIPLGDNIRFMVCHIGIRSQLSIHCATFLVVKVVSLEQ